MAILASLNDINAWLPDDKAKIGDGDDNAFQIEAQRIIKGQLVGVFAPTTLAGWSSPDDTPQVIRSVAGELIAAYWYRELFSEDDTSANEYAQQLYNEAILKLTQIRTGELTVTGDDYVPIEMNQLVLNNLDFWPNADTIGPFFTMDRESG